MLGSTENPSDELLVFGNKIDMSINKMREDLIVREDGLKEILEIYGDSLHGGNILDSIDIKSTNYFFKALGKRNKRFKWYGR